MFSMLLALITTLIAPTVACTPTDVESAVQGGILAFATMDEAGVDDAVTAVDAQVACQAEPLPLATVAQVHRIHGLAAFLNGDSDAAKADFSAALALEPTATLPVKIAPQGGKLARLYAESMIPAGPKVDLALSGDYRGFVDGKESTTRSADRPAIVQLSEYDVVKYSSWMAANSPIPSQFKLGGGAASTSTMSISERVAAEKKAKDEDSKAEKETKAEQEPKPEREPKAEKEPKAKAETAERDIGPSPHHNAGVWVGAAVTAAVAGGLFATSAITNSTFDNDPTKLGYTLNHVGYWGSIGTGALAVGLFTVAIAGSF